MPAISATSAFVAALFAMLAMPVSAHANAGEEVVPLIGVDGPDMDACTALGKISAKDEKHEKWHSVRAVASSNARQKDELAPATLVWLCEAKGEWQGIVYPAGQFQDIGDCRVGSPVDKPQPYSGPCAYGWIEADAIQLVAG